MARLIPTIATESTRNTTNERLLWIAVIERALIDVRNGDAQAFAFFEWSDSPFWTICKEMDWDGPKMSKAVLAQAPAKRERKIYKGNVEAVSTVQVTHVGTWTTELVQQAGAL